VQCRLLRVFFLRRLHGPSGEIMCGLCLLFYFPPSVGFCGPRSQCSRKSALRRVMTAVCLITAFSSFCAPEPKLTCHVVLLVLVSFLWKRFHGKRSSFFLFSSRFFSRRLSILFLFAFAVNDGGFVSSGCFSLFFLRTGSSPSQISGKSEEIFFFRTSLHRYAFASLFFFPPIILSRFGLSRANPATICPLPFCFA